MKYFNGINKLSELKKKFFELAKKLHPDNGGNAEEFKAMKSEFEKMVKHLEIYGEKEENKTGAGGDNSDNSTGFNFGLFAVVIEKIAGLDGLIIELVGSWLWVSGNTFAHKDMLKSLGFKWAAKKKAWYLHFEPFVKRKKSNLSLDDIKLKYGCRSIKGSTTKRLATA